MQLKNKTQESGDLMSNGYLGTSKLEISSANTELIPNSPSEWTHGYRLHKFSFRNKQATNVIINGTTNLYLEANQGFEMTRGDKEIESFVIVNSGINYIWIGAY